MNLHTILLNLVEGLSNFSLGNFVMLMIAGILIYLGIARQYEPILLLPIGFGCILANIPMSGLTDENGLF